MGTQRLRLAIDIYVCQSLATCRKIHSGASKSLERAYTCTVHLLVYLRTYHCSRQQAPNNNQAWSSAVCGCLQQHATRPNISGNISSSTPMHESCCCRII